MTIWEGCSLMEGREGKTQSSTDGKGRRKSKQTDACNEETPQRFASAHKLSEAIWEDEQMERKEEEEEKKGEKRREGRKEVKCWRGKEFKGKVKRVGRWETFKKREVVDNRGKKTQKVSGKKRELGEEGKRWGQEARRLTFIQWAEGISNMASSARVWQMAGGRVC